MEDNSKSKIQKESWHPEGQIRRMPLQILKRVDGNSGLAGSTGDDVCKSLHPSAGTTRDMGCISEMAVQELYCVTEDIWT